MFFLFTEDMAVNLEHQYWSFGLELERYLKEGEERVEQKKIRERKRSRREVKPEEVSREYLEGENGGIRRNQVYRVEEK